VEDAVRPISDVAIVVAGGAPVDPRVLKGLPGDARVIAADSGLGHARALGLDADVVVGDMDSVDPTDLAEAEAAGALVVRHPVAKDATDLELALGYAHREGHRRTVVIGGAGGRISHLLGNAAVIAAPALGDMEVEWRLAQATIRVVRPASPAGIGGTPGDLVSLLAVGGPAHGVTTTGLRWRLDDATLQPGSTRGISNEMTAAAAGVTLRRGVVLAIHERTEP
jgi:thiamine pyrophosphokinase